MEDKSIGIEVFDTSTAINGRKAEIAKQAMSIEHIPTMTDIQVDLDQATKLPLGELTSLGTGFASMPDMFRTITQTIEISGEGLLRATDKFGNTLDTNILQAFNDNSGLLGSFRDASDGFGQARLHPVASQTAEAITSIPYDPTTMFMAAALMEINKKLDAIQETQEKMFEYLKDKDRAELRGNLQTLSDVLNNYRYNWNNPQYKNNKHILVQSIRNDAEKAIIQHRAGINRELKKKNPIHIDKDVRDKATAVHSELEEYRLSVYLYSFSSFLEIMLLENYDPRYLSSTADKIEDYSLSYRDLYTKAYDLIELDADSSVRAIAIDGLSGAARFLGKALEKTPIGDATPIDEALQDASKGLKSFSKDVKKEMLSSLPDARSSDVRPFVDNIKNVNHLYNDPVMLLADSEAIYVLPVDTSQGNATSDKDEELEER